jgi:Holliday junction resolvase RusA-like endonuclease
VTRGGQLGNRAHRADVCGQLGNRTDSTFARRSASTQHFGAAASYSQREYNTPPHTSTPHNEEQTGNRQHSPDSPARLGAVPAPPRCGRSEAPYPQTKPEPEDRNQMTPTADRNSGRVVSFTEYFNPPTATAQERRHDNHVGTYLPTAVRLARATYRAVLEQHAPSQPLDGPLAVSIVWTFATKTATRNLNPEPKITRPDLDNLAKLVLDAATKAGYWHDDAQITDLRLRKFAGAWPGLAMEAAEMPAEASRSPRAQRKTARTTKDAHQD